jgi:hypothetical protein
MNKKKKVLKIKWQRLISKGKTCPRCGSTERELNKAIVVLKKTLAPLDIGVVLEKGTISMSGFKKDPLQSNRIWINDRPLEDYIQGRVGQSACCDVCGSNECRTVEIGEQVYETIPSEIIIKAGFSAASQMVNARIGKSCCEE